MTRLSEDPLNLPIGDKPQRLGCDHPAASLFAYAEDWLRGAELRVRPRTLDSYRSQLRCYVLPELGSRSVPSLIGADVDTLEETLVARGLSAGTISNAISVLRLVLADAGEHLPCNPAARSNRPSLAPRPICSSDRLIPYRAAKATGVPLDTLRDWIKRGRVSILDGRVLIADVERARDAKVGTSALQDVMQKLGCHRAVVRRLVELGELPASRNGRYANAPVERLAKLFERDRRERISFNAAVEQYGGEYGVSWSGLEHIIEREQISVLVRPWDGRQTRLLPRAVLDDAVRRADDNNEPCACGCKRMPAPGSSYLPGHSIKLAVAKSHEKEAREKRATSRLEWLQTPAADTWWASVTGERVDRLRCPCAICGEIELLAPSQIPKWGRTLCDPCWPRYRAALRRAKYAAAQINRDGLLKAADHDAFTRLLAVGKCGGSSLGVHERVQKLIELRQQGHTNSEMGALVGLSEAAIHVQLWKIDRGELAVCCFEHSIRAVRPRKRGAQQPVGLDLAIAALHWAGFSDARITELIRYAQRMRRLTIPRVHGLIHDNYVKERRESRSIGRRPSGLGIIEEARQVLAEAGTPLHLSAITDRIYEMRVAHADRQKARASAGEPKPVVQPDQNVIGTVLRREAQKGVVFCKTAPATFTIVGAAAEGLEPNPGSTVSF